MTNYVGANAETELELTNEKMPNKLTFGPKKTFKYTVATAPGGVTYALTYFMEMSAVQLVRTKDEEQRVLCIII